jgi:hypothetical protein
MSSAIGSWSEGGLRGNRLVNLPRGVQGCLRLSLSDVYLQLVLLVVLVIAVVPEIVMPVLVVLV